MAVINSVTPNQGISTGRYIVVIDGSGFRIPDLLPGSDTWQESVRVWVDGNQVDSSDVFVRSETKIEFRMATSFRPISPDAGNDPYAVDVKVQNVDANGDLILGSDDTLADGFSYVKISTSTDSITDLVTRELVRYLRRNLPLPVYLLSHVDYSTGSASPVVDGPEQAKEPCVYLEGPRRVTTGEGTQRVRNTWPVTGPETRWLPEATDLVFDIVLESSRGVILRNLMPRIDTLIQHIPFIILTVMGSEYKMDTFMTDRMSKDADILFGSSLQQASGALKIESVPLETDIIRLNKDITDIVITIGELNV